MSFQIPKVQPFASRPPGFYCYICGKEYGSSSLRVHFKSCLKQWEANENLKSKKERRPAPTPPPELTTIYDMMKRGVKIDPKIIDFYNEKAIRLWEEKFCLKCGSCGRMIPHSMKESHKKLCVSMPQIQTPTESLQEAIVKDFPYEPKQQSSQQKHTESTEHSFTASESQPKLLPSPKFTDYPEEEMMLRECDICGRKIKEERLQRHERACETQLRGQWKHDQMIKRAQAKQLANLQFHDFEKRYKTHKWKKQHAELEELFALSKDALDKSISKEFELIHLDFVECNTCNRMFHPKRINFHSEHCQKTHQKPKERKPLYSPRTEGKVHTLSKGMQRSEKESLKSVTQDRKSVV